MNVICLAPSVDYITRISSKFCREKKTIVYYDNIVFDVINVFALLPFRYQVDGNARVTAIDVTIGNKELPQMKLKYSQDIGILENISDLRMYKNTFNKTVIHDTAKQYFSISEYDDHGRLKSVITNVKSMDVYRYVVFSTFFGINSILKKKKKILVDWNWSTTSETEFRPKRSRWAGRKFITR